MPRDIDQTAPYGDQLAEARECLALFENVSNDPAARVLCDVLRWIIFRLDELPAPLPQVDDDPLLVPTFLRRRIAPR